MRENNKSEDNSLSNFFCDFKSLGNKITEVIPWKCGDTTVSEGSCSHAHFTMDTSTCPLGHFKQRAVHFQFRLKFCFLILAIWNWRGRWWEELIENLNKLVTPM